MAEAIKWAEIKELKILILSKQELGAFNFQYLVNTVLSMESSLELILFIVKFCQDI